MTTELTGLVTKLAFGGEGIVRHEGLVVFVPFTAIGDLIRFQILSKKKNFAKGKLLEVLEASPSRIVPVCPYFGICGGCQLQHINYQGQLAYKQQSIQEALHKLAGLANPSLPPIFSADRQWSYRRRITLTLSPHQGNFQAGYLSIDNSPIAVKECAIFIPRENPLILDLQNIVSQLENASQQAGKVMLLKNEGDRFLWHFQFETMPSNITTVMETALAAYQYLSGIMVTSPGKLYTFGNVQPKIHLDGLTFSFSPQAFIQSHPEQSQLIYESIVKYAQELASHHILDLYCGIGVSSIMLAKHGYRVIGIENNEEAISMARANAQANSLEGKTQFIHASVQHVLAKLLKKYLCDFIIVNPPRIGLDRKVIHALLNARPKAILYISCMPPTLARDLKFFLEQGYQLQIVEAYDMFPQTAHVETLALLTAIEH